MAIGAILLLPILGFLVYHRARAKYRAEIAKYPTLYAENPKTIKKDALMEAFITGLKWTFLSMAVYMAFLVWVTTWID